MPNTRSEFDPVKIFKIGDPTLQSMILTWFFFAVDQRGDDFRQVFFLLLAVQAVSWVANWFIPFPKRMKVQRVAVFIAFMAWAAIYHYVKTRIREVRVTDIDLRVFAKTGVHDFYLMLAGILLAAWYFYICFREVRSMLKKKKKKRN